MDKVFNELYQLLKNRHEILNEELDKLCQERICIISEIKELKQQVDKSMKEFDHLDSMTTFDMTHKKITSLEVVLKDFEKMISEFQFGSVQQLHEMKWKNDEIELNELKQQIEKYGTLDPSLRGALQEISNEWLNDDVYTQVSILNDTVVELSNINSGLSFVFNNTKMESGIFQWKVKIDNLASWIAVGVSTHEVVSSKRFNAFIYHFEPHHSFLMSHNGGTWSLDWNENDGKNGFKFTKGSELELEMNCNTQQLTIRKVGSGEFVTLNNVELP